jgi:hypothetical protein
VQPQVALPVKLKVGSWLRVANEHQKEGFAASEEEHATNSKSASDLFVTKLVVVGMLLQEPGNAAYVMPDEAERWWALTASNTVTV